MDTHITIRLPENMLIELERRVATMRSDPLQSRNVTRSDVIRQAIAHFLRKANR